jgi:hypothetical protein
VGEEERFDQDAFICALPQNPAFDSPIRMMNQVLPCTAFLV